MTRLLTALCLTVFALVANAAELSVRVAGAPAAQTLVFQIYDSPSAFGGFREPARQVRLEQNAQQTYQITDVPVGAIAVLVFADTNANGQLDRNFIGIPQEPIGLSNSYRPKGPPTFERAQLWISADEITAVDIALYKVLGERGQLGVGIGAIGLSSPYVGADSGIFRPIPVITYNGERLQWLGPTLQYGLVGTGRWRLAASASYRIGVYEEEDSDALIGLGDRSGTLMSGLSLRYEAPAGVDLAFGYEHDVLDKIGGGSATLRVSRGLQWGRLRIAPQARINWLSSRLADYDFGVPERAATAARSAYRVGSAVTVEAGVSTFFELAENWLVLFNVSAEFLPTEITDSPIVAGSQVIKGFAAITYVF